MIVIFAVAVALLIFVTPFSLKVGVRFSLNGQKCFIRAKILGVSVVKIKLENKDGAVRILINGRKPRKLFEKNDKKTKTVMPDVPRLARFLRAEKIVREVLCIGIIGGDDAEDAAYNFGAFASAVCMLLPSANTSFVYPDFKSNRFDLDMTVNAKISPFQVIRAATLWA